VFRSFLFQPFNIPSGSMEDTLLIGDFLFVEKFAYGYSRHSLPFSIPLIPGPGRLFFHSPKRGDVVVFKTPHDNRTDFIKRLIGLPGDEIQVQHGILYVCPAGGGGCETDDRGNLEPQYAVKRVRVGEVQSVDPRGGMMGVATKYIETLPGGVQHDILEFGDDRALDNTGVFVVPTGYFFMMGDNRDNSTDSRVPVEDGGVGYVPAVNLVGKADVRFFSIKIPPQFYQLWNWHIRFGRMFTAIR
jgi:signal peptidase I